jgi:hypothetical protein
VPLGYDEGMTRLDRRSLLAFLATSAAAGLAGVGTPVVAQSASGRNTAVNAESRPDAATLLALLPKRAGKWKLDDSTVQPKQRGGSGAGRVVTGHYLAGTTEATLTLTDLAAQAGLAAAGQATERSTNDGPDGKETVYPDGTATVRELVRAGGKGSEVTVTTTNGFVVAAASAAATVADLKALAAGVDRKKLAALR